MVSAGHHLQAHPVIEHASMEPCLFRHGKHIPEAGVLKPLLASMEPCLFRHGKGIMHYLHQLLTNASMEPCLFRHGKPRGSTPRYPEKGCFNGAMSFQTW